MNLNWKTILKKAGIILLSTLLFALCSGLLYITKMAGSINITRPEDEPELASAMTNENLDTETQEKLGGYWTIAVFGVDSRNGKLGKENLPLGQLDALDENLKDMREACNREGYIIDKIKFPLLDRIILLEKNRIAVTKKLMLNTDLHLKDHLVEGKHVFAGVMHVESACELCKLYLEQKGLYDYHITGVEGFKFEKFIKVFKNRGGKKKGANVPAIKTIH